MASKLFRAVVGVGIAASAVAAACSELTLPPPLDGDDASADAPAEALPAVDAEPDVVEDAGLHDAFPDTTWCDSSWPTTKGTPHPPDCVDPNGECHSDQVTQTGPCTPTEQPGHCYANEGGYFPYCVEGRWKCQPGYAAIGECSCAVDINCGDASMGDR